MSGGVSGTKQFSSVVVEPEEVFHLPDPGLVTRFESFACIVMVKGPPPGIPRDLVTGQTVNFAVSCNGCEKIKKVLNDLNSSR